MKPRKLLWVGIVVACTASGLAGERSNLVNRGAFNPRIAKLITPQIRTSLSLALTEMAFGSQKRAKSHAETVAIPQNLRVFVSTNGINGSRAERMKDWAQICLDSWNSNTGQTTFTQVSSSDLADVQLVLLNEVREGHARLAGFTDWSRSSSGNGSTLSAVIRISSRDFFGNQMSETQIKKAISHELGHVLGLDDDAQSDLMSNVGSHGGEVDEMEVSAVLELDNRARSIAEMPGVRTVRNNVPKVFEFAPAR